MRLEAQIQIIIVDDESAIQVSLSRFLVKLGYKVHTCSSAEEALGLLEDKHPDIMLLDIRMPDMDGLTLLGKLRKEWPDMAVIMITGHGTMDSAIESLRLGASDFLRKPIRLTELEAALDRCSSRFYSMRRHDNSKSIFSTSKSPEQRYIGISEMTKNVRAQVKLAAESGCQSLLISGETGTGKEIVADLFHILRYSEKAPFIAVNCPALPESLVESELMGHTKGAFTGATADRLGAFELANGGVLFLDEISDLSFASQAKLLRILETRKVRKIGGSEEKMVDVSIVAATNKRLDQCVRDKTFRDDLFFRLNVFEIIIHPLRKRMEDVIPLAEHFVSEYCVRVGLPMSLISEDAKNALLDYSYPGNVRELRNIIERAIILSNKKPISKKHLVFSDNILASTAMKHKLEFNAPPALLDEIEEILAVLRECGWNKSKAARRLGISYDALRWRIKKFGVSEDQK